MTAEKHFKQLIKNGRTFVKGIKLYHELAAYAEAKGYRVSNGTYLPGSMKIKVRLEVAE